MLFVLFVVSLGEEFGSPGSQLIRVQEASTLTDVNELKGSETQVSAGVRGRTDVLLRV